MAKYVSTVPFGKCSITAAGTPTPLSQNCGQLQGTVAGIPGQVLVQITIQAATANTGNLYLLPRGNTASANPDAIMLELAAGGSVTLPVGLIDDNGYLPENFVLDTDAVSGTQYFYGFGILR